MSHIPPWIRGSWPSRTLRQRQKVRASQDADALCLREQRSVDDQTDDNIIALKFN